MKKALWIEDGANVELSNLCGPVYYSGEYDFTIAEDVSGAVALLQGREYDAVIVDMRLPPGQDEHWSGLYRQNGRDKSRAKLGLELLRWLFPKEPSDHMAYQAPRPSWVQPERFGVFSVELASEANQYLAPLGISSDVFLQKTAGLKDDVLIELIKKIIGQQVEAPASPATTSNSPTTAA